MSVESSIDFPAMHSLSGVVVYAEAKDDNGLEKSKQLLEPLLTKNGILNKSWLFQHNCDFYKDVSTLFCDEGFTLRVMREINSFTELFRSFFIQVFRLTCSRFNYESCCRRKRNF